MQIELYAKINAFALKNDPLKRTPQRMAKNIIALCDYRIKTVFYKKTHDA